MSFSSWQSKKGGGMRICYGILYRPPFIPRCRKTASSAGRSAPLCWAAGQQPLFRLNLVKLEVLSQGIIGRSIFRAAIKQI